MSVESVLDTNILLYAASKDPADAAKAVIALDLIGMSGFGITLQIVQEFFHNARIKARLAISPDHCEKMVEALLRRPIAMTDAELFFDARRICRRHQLRYWDAAVIAGARRLGAGILYSEDLNHGQEYDGVRVVNPFLTA